MRRRPLSPLARSVSSAFTSASFRVKVAAAAAAVVAAATDANHMRPTSNDSVVTIDSSNSSILSAVSIRPPESASVRLHSDEILDVRVFIDRSIVEVFIDDQQCLAVRVYPSLVASTGMSVIGLGGTAELVSLDIWEMRSIY